MQEANLSDRLFRFVLNRAPVRGEFVSLDLSWSEVVIRHALPAAVRNQLGELTAAGLLLVASLKFSGKLILQIHGRGPVSLFVVECDAQGSFRATVKLRDDAEVASDASLADLVNQDGEGRFVVTLDPDQPRADAYQGIVAFEGTTIAEALEAYMSRSEQVPTRLWLAADEHRAAGLLLQRLPDEGGRSAAGNGAAGNGAAGNGAVGNGAAGNGAAADGADGNEAADEDAWPRLTMLAETLSRDELLTQSGPEILRRLFWQERLEGLHDRECRFQCTCSRAKVGAMLKMLGRQEVEDVLVEQSSVSVSCEFCNQTYEFDSADCAALFAEADEDPET